MSRGTGVDIGRVATTIATLQETDLLEGELHAALNAVVEATSDVFGADGAGVMLIDDQQALHYVGATDGQAAALEAAQEEAGQGPCIDSLVNDQIVHTEDLLEDPRWPGLRAETESSGVRAILGVPLHIGGTTVGSLNVYRFTSGEWQPDDVDGIVAFGRLVEEMLATAMVARERHTLVDQLSTALDSRVTIERAVGVIMATRGLDPVPAFDALRRRARARRIRVGDLAAEVIETRQLEDET